MPLWRADSPNAMWIAGVAAAAIGLLATTAVFRTAPQNEGKPQFTVSQKGRLFSVAALSVNRDAVIRIMNDDGNLRHHAYVKSPEFSFDSGDQEPDTSTDIKFTVPGKFDVLCAIHPKMRLVVKVK